MRQRESYWLFHAIVSCANFYRYMQHEQFEVISIFELFRLDEQLVWLFLRYF